MAAVQLVVEDDRIAAHLRGSGTHLGMFGGVSPTRWHANVAEFVIYRVVNGLITEASSSADNRELLARLDATGVRHPQSNSGNVIMHIIGVKPASCSRCRIAEKLNLFHGTRRMQGWSGLSLPQICKVATSSTFVVSGCS